MGIEGKFYQEIHALEVKYSELFKPLYDKRKAVVNGNYEPTEEEGTWVEPGEDDEDDEEDEEKGEDKKEEEEDYKGIKEFWMTAMKNVETIAEMIEPHDEPILTHLTDIRLLFSSKQGEEESSEDDIGFALEFHFSTNDYFTNSVLTKSYKMKCVPDEDDPFSFEGSEIVGCTGCKIHWKKGKNVTEKVVKKKQKHKGKA